MLLSSSTKSSWSTSSSKLWCRFFTLKFLNFSGIDFELNTSGLLLLFDSIEGGGHSVFSNDGFVWIGILWDFFLSISATLSYIKRERKLPYF